MERREKGIGLKRARRVLAEVKLSRLRQESVSNSSINWSNQFSSSWPNAARTDPHQTEPYQSDCAANPRSFVHNKLFIIRVAQLAVLVDDFNLARDLAVHLRWWFDSLHIGS